MAADDTAVVVTLRANVRDYEAAMKTAVRATERAAQAAEKAVANIGKGANIRQAARNMDVLKNSTQAATAALKSTGSVLSSFAGGLAAGVVGGGLISGFGQLIEANTRIKNSLKVAGLEGQNLTKVYEQLRRSAVANGANFESLATLFARLTIQSKELGLSQQQVLLFVDRMSQGLRASGTDAQQASDGIRQLTQAMASGVLRGDEFNSVMENLPVVASAIADGLGVSIGALRKMATEGKLDAKTVYDAFIKGSEDFAAQAEKTSKTFSQSMQNMTSSLIALAGAFDESFKSSKALNEIMSNMTGTVDALTTTVNEHTETWDDFFRRFAINLGILPAFIGATTDNSVAIDGMRTSFNELTQAIQNTLNTQKGSRGFVAELLGTGRGDELDKIVESVVKLEAKIKDNTATAEDFKTVLDLITATQLASGDAIVASLEEQSKKWLRLKDLLYDPQKAMEDLAKTIVESVGSALDAIIQKLGTELPASTQKWIEALKSAAGQISTVQGQIERFPGFIPGAIQGTPGGLTTGNVTFNPTEAKEFLKSRTPSAKYKARMDAMDDELATYLSKLFQLLPKAEIISGVRTNAEQAEIWERSGHGKLFAAAPPGHSRHERGGAVDIGGVTSAELQAAVKQIPELETLARINDDMHVQLKKGMDLNEEYATTTDKASTALDDWLKKSEEAIALKEKENEIDKDFTATQDQKAVAKEREAFIQQGLNAVMQQYGTISDENRAKVIAAADAQARLGLAAANTADAQKKAADAAKKQADAAQDFAQQIAGVAQSAIGGLISDLRSGVDAGEAFNNMLNRILDSLINIALQQLFSPQAMGGIIGSLLGVPAASKGGIVGGGFQRDIRKVNPLVFAGAPSMASGGMITGGGVPIIAHPGELVIPKSMVGKMGSGNTSVNNQLGNVSIDMSSTGVVAAGHDQARQFGENVRKIIALEMVRESRPGGLLRRTETGAG